MVLPVSDDEVVGPSDRSFGVVFAVVFAIIAFFPVWSGGGIRLWAVAISVGCGVLALAWPRVLAPANRLWLRFGLALHRIVNPIVMAVLFFVVFTPFGLVIRLAGRGLRRQLRPDPSLSSYWIDRTDTRSRMDKPF